MTKWTSKGAPKLTDSVTNNPKVGRAFVADVRVTPVAPENRTPQQRRLLEPVRGDDAANVFATLAAHPNLFEAWLPFCLYLLRCPEFSPRHREMVILRT